MPVTPFHFGPGLALKAAAPRRVSWTAFVAANILIDCETLYYIVENRYPLHRTLHTFIGAVCAGLAAGAALELAARLVPRLRAWGAEWETRALLLGGFLGGVTHPILDGIMHDDIRPFLPFTEANPLHGLVGLGTLHLGCLLAGVAGAVLLTKTRH